MAIAVVTGASTGIGRAVAVKLGSNGYTVVVNSLADAEGGRSTADAIVSLGGTASYIKADVSTNEGASSVIDFAVQSYGQPTVLVNNAGATRNQELGQWTEQHWHDMLDTNLMTVAMMSQMFVSAFEDAIEGSIVNIGSVRGLTHAPRIGIAAYSAAKAGVINLTSALARELAPNIVVNCISPGFVETAYMTRADPVLVSKWRKEMPIERLIQPEEIADVAAFLIEQRAVTGANIVADGGWTIAS